MKDKKGNVKLKGGKMRQETKKNLLKGSNMNNEEYIRKDFWSKIKKYAGQIPFVRDVVAMYYAMLDEKTPVKAKITIVGALAYFIMPFDAIPDIIGPLGFTDDAAVISAALAVVNQYITDEHYESADVFLNNENNLRGEFNA